MEKATVNLLALSAGIWLATWALSFWIKNETRVTGLISGGAQIAPPGAAPAGS